MLADRGLGARSIQRRAGDLESNMTASVETMRSVGAGRFVLERPVGAGGMGTVYRALDRETGAPVAVKLLTSGPCAARWRRSPGTPPAPSRI